VQALVKSGNENSFSFEILKAVMEVNESQKTILMPKIRNFFRGNLSGKKIAIWGLAFKPDTDDIREAPALYIIDELLKDGAEVVAYDPEAMGNVKTLLGDKIGFVENEYDAINEADALVICTEWGVFRNPDFDKISSLLKDKVIFDGRNLFDLNEMTEKGFFYSSIGRSVISANTQID
jgi:UDPglucose 6-dehydrogenase